jgi:hypothetical protein
MVWQIGKVLLASIVITFSSWLAGKQPRLAGFIMALPISSMLALAFSQAEFQDWGKSVGFAKSILVAVPLSLLFFVPFLFADKLRWPFWALYLSGLGLLAIGYGLHSAVVRG